MIIDKRERKKGVGERSVVTLTSLLMHLYTLILFRVSAAPSQRQYARQPTLHLVLVQFGTKQKVLINRKLLLLSFPLTHFHLNS